MRKIIVDYYYDFAEVKIEDKTQIVCVEDLSEIKVLADFIGENLDVEIEERNCN